MFFLKVTESPSQSLSSEFNSPVRDDSFQTGGGVRSTNPCIHDRNDIKSAVGTTEVVSVAPTELFCCELCAVTMSDGVMK